MGEHSELEPGAAARGGGLLRSWAGGPWRLAVVVGVALVVLGVGGWLAGSALQQAGAGRLGPNAPVSAGAADPRDFTAHNSPAIARNPVDAGNLAAVSRVDTPTFSCALHVSFDAAASWREIDVPFPDSEETNPERCYAPDVAFGPDGRLHLTFVTLEGLGNTPSAVWHVASEDGGETLSEPVRITGDLAFQAQLTADPREPERLYVTWLQASEVTTVGFGDAGNPIVAARSDDGGATWTEPVEVNDAARERVLAPTPTVTGDGTVYVAYVDVRDDRLDYHGGHELRGGPAYPGPWSLVLAVSTDAGDTWSETVVDDALVPIERIVAFLPDFPSVAVDDESGRVYVAFHDARRGDADVWLWAADDPLGDGFTSPTRLNDTPISDGTSQHLPAVAVAPTGRVDVVYYDRRGDADDTLTEVSLQSSRDGGESFAGAVTLSDRAFDSRIGFGSDQGLPDLGSRLGVVSTDTAVLAMWADTRHGTRATNKQVLARAVATVDAAVVPGTPVRVAGAVAAVAGLLILAGALVAALRAFRARRLTDDGAAPDRRFPPPPPCVEPRPQPEAGATSDASTVPTRRPPT